MGMGMEVKMISVGVGMWENALRKKFPLMSNSKLNKE